MSRYSKLARMRSIDALDFADGTNPDEIQAQQIDSSAYHGASSFASLDDEIDDTERWDSMGTQVPNTPQNFLEYFALQDLHD